jgi:AraC-like DNA-binding protein
MGTLELASVGLAGSGVGTALAIPMVWPRSARSADVRLMGGWLLATSAIVALISARVIGLVPGSAAINHTINLLGFCAYPLLYLGIRAQSSAPGRIRNSWWLWLPAGVYLTIVLVRGGLGGVTDIPFSWILPVLLAFTAACAVAVARCPTPPTAILPARFIVLFLAVLNLAQIVRMQFGHVAPIPALVPLVMTGGFVALVGVLIWRGLECGATAALAATADAPGPRYEKSSLDREAAVALLAAVDRALTADRLFVDPALTLGRLAAAVGSTPHQVSEVLNRYAEVTFHDLVNRHRMAEVKAQLSDPASDRFTIEGIGAAAGFGSRSALYAAFRRLEGMTPTAFRARARRAAETQSGSAPP